MSTESSERHRSSLKKSLSAGSVTARFVFPVLLLLYALIAADQGAELSDTMYSVGNYAFFHESTGSWLYATWLSNLFGRLLFLICGGRLLYLNLVCRLFSAAAALTVYELLKKRIHPLLLFLAELAALGLVWSPSVILYQNLSVLALTAAALLLYSGLMERSRRRMFAAGLILGAALLVRVSNLTYCALILLVFYDDIKYKRTRSLPGDLGCCIGGYAAGLAAALLTIPVFGSGSGLGESMDWLFGLFSGKSGGGGYTAGEMLSSIADNYLGNLYWVFFAAAGMGLGTVMFLLLKERFVPVKKLLYCAGLVLLLWYYVRNGVADRAWYNVGSIFGISVVCLWLLAALDLWVLIDRKTEAREKGLALTALLVQLIAPLGSNNHLYSVIGCMFLLLPAGLHFLIGLGGSRGKGKAWSFPVLSMGIALFLLLLVQSAGFHFSFAFKDGTDGTARDSRIETPDTLRGLKTTAAHAEAIRGLGGALSDAEGRLLTFGDLPGLHYVFELPPALSTLWPDLESYPAADYEQELRAVFASGERPLLILSREAQEALLSDGGKSYGDGKKLSLLGDFLYNGHYTAAYENEEFVLYESEQR